MNRRRPTLTRPITALAMLGLLLTGVVHAVPLDEAVAAYDAGNYVQAGQMLYTHAENGNPEAQFRLGSLHSLGQGTPVNHEVAALWFEKAAERGHHEATVTLANMYLSGLGVPRDEAAALAWFERAATIAEEQEIEEEECD